jgi:hypothetical protein
LTTTFRSITSKNQGRYQEKKAACKELSFPERGFIVVKAPKCHTPFLKMGVVCSWVVDAGCCAEPHYNVTINIGTREMRGKS